MHDSHVDMKGKVLHMLRTCGGATLTAYLQVPEGSCSGSISLTRNNAIVASPYLSHLLTVTKDLSERGVSVSLAMLLLKWLRIP